MKISTEIKKLKKRIKPLIDDHVAFLMIGFEYLDESKSWTITPQYESGGDGHPLYIEIEGTGVGLNPLLQGTGKTLPAAIKNLNQSLDNIEKNNICLFRWA